MTQFANTPAHPMSLSDQTPSDQTPSDHVPADHVPSDDTSDDTSPDPAGPARRSWSPAERPKPGSAGRDKSVADLAAAAVRQANARECFVALRDADEPLTVADLTSRTGLSRPTVDAVLQDLIAAGPVRTAQPSDSCTPGRPARRFVADPSTTLVAGVEVGEREIRCTVSDGAGTVVLATSTAVDRDDRTDRLDIVADLLAATLDRATDRRPSETGEAERDTHLSAVGLAVPGILDHDQCVVRSTQIPEWTGARPGAELSRRLGCPVHVENDLKLAAYAEHHIGRTAENMIFLHLGRRISVALIVGGRILQGSHRMAGELGTQRGMRWTASYDDGGLCWSSGRDGRPVFERAAAGDDRAMAEIDSFCEQLAPRLATLVLTLDPDLVVVGGGLSRAGRTLLRPLGEHLDRLLDLQARPELVAAQLTPNGAVTGALAYAFEHGSEEIFGIPAVPPPWHRLRTERQTHPPSQADGADTQ